MTAVGVDRAANRMRDLADRARDLTPIWGDVSELVAEAMARQFQTQGASGGAPWPPLNPRYAGWKVRKAGPMNLLVFTTALHNSLTSSPLDVEVRSPQSAEFGTSVSYYKFHHHGTSKMPQRRILKWHQPLNTEVTHKLRRYLMSGHG